MPKIKSPTVFVLFKRRSGIAETADIWKRTMRLELKTLGSHIIKLSRMRYDNQVFAVKF